MDGVSLQTTNMTKLFTLVLSLIVFQAFAQVRYTDLNPDYYQNSSGSKNFDVNGDLKPDLQFSLTILDPMFDVWFVLNTDDSVDVMIDTAHFNFVGMVANGFVIHQGLKWKSGNNLPIAYLTSGSAEGEWPGSTDKYLVYRLRNGQNSQYGWLRMSVHNKVNNFTVKGYAYEETVNTPLATDDNWTGFTEMEKPEPDLKAYLKGRTITFNTTLSYAMIDMTGKEILVGKTEDDNECVDISALSPGVYTMKLMGSKGVVINKWYIN